MASYRVVGVGFDHMHIGDQLAVARDHPSAEVVGVCDAGRDDRAPGVLADLDLDAPVHGSVAELVERTRPDIAFVCTSTAEHPAAVAALAEAGVHVILEKPMADSDEAARAMVASAESAGTALTVNWPLAWVPAHRTAQRIAASGEIGRIEQVHFHDGNRGPLFHGHGKTELHPTVEQKADSWWYDPELGGGSLRDYLGYGTTLGTWFRGGDLPRAVTAVWHIPDGLRVDEQAVVIGHYTEGLSVFETRWGTFTDPWTEQPQPHCGFVVNGTEGSVSSWDYADHVTVHDRDGVHRIPNDDIPPEDETALANLIAHLDSGRPLDPPLTAAVSRDAHTIVEAAVVSASEGRTVELR